MANICNWCGLPITEVPFSELVVFMNGKREKASMHTICVRGWELENKGLLVPLSASSEGQTDGDEDGGLFNEGEDDD